MVSRWSLIRCAASCWRRLQIPNPSLQIYILAINELPTLRARAGRRPGNAVSHSATARTTRLCASVAAMAAGLLGTVSFVLLPLLVRRAQAAPARPSVSGCSSADTNATERLPLLATTSAHVSKSVALVCELLLLQAPRLYRCQGLSLCEAVQLQLRRAGMDCAS